MHNSSVTFQAFNTPCWNRFLQIQREETCFDPQTSLLHLCVERSLTGPKTRAVPEAGGGAGGREELMRIMRLSQFPWLFWYII